jgi:hypothetical protein
VTGSVGRAAVLAQLTQVLNEFKVLQDEVSRRLVVSQVEQWTEQRIPQGDVAALVEAAAGRAARLPMLLGYLEGMEGQTAHVRHARRLLDEWEALDLFPDADLLALREILRDQPVHADAVSPPHTVPAHYDTAWSAFVHLAGFNAGADGVPPCMAFLERLADRLGPEIAARVRSWNDQVATDLGIATQLRLVRGQSARPGEVTTGVFLVVQLEPDPLDADIYRLSHWIHQQGDVAETIRRGEDSIVSMADLPARIQELTDRVEAASESPVTLEFVVPHNLLDLPFERWSPPPAEQYAVVIRSLERIQSRKWHRAWHERWRQLRQDSQPTVFWATQAEGSRRELTARLAADPDVVCVVLSNPPAADRHDELQVALRSGLPVIMWHREDCSSKSFLDAVSSLTNGPLVDLPARLREVRRLQQGDPASEGLVVLWDDPERQPGAGRLPAPARSEAAGE